MKIKLKLAKQYYKKQKQKHHHKLIYNLKKF